MNVILVILISQVFAKDPVKATGMGLQNKVKIKYQKSSQEFQNNNSEEDNLQKIELTSQKRKHLIQEIKKFIRDAKEGAQKAELNLRLGALYMEDYYACLAKANNVLDIKLKTDKKAKLDTSEADSSLQKARTIYKDLVRRYPKHPKHDEMLYFLGVSALDKHLVAEGMRYFETLSKEHPKSKYIYDVQVQLGDHYFETNKFKISEGYFDFIIQRKYSPLLAYAFYKKAWCQYNYGNKQKAIDLFKWVIQNEEKMAGASIKVRGEAVKDITLPFVDLRLVDESIRFFEAQGAPHYRKGIENMALLYGEKGFYKEAIKMNEVLLAMDPNYTKNPIYEIRVIECFHSLKQEKFALERLFQKMPKYLEGSTWYELNSSQVSVVKEASREFEEITRKYALELHSHAQKLKKEELYELAKLSYQKYLEYFPKTSQSTQIRFNYAEILYRHKQYMAAADQYYQVYKDPQSPNLKQESLKYTLASLENELTNERKKLGLVAVSKTTTAKLTDQKEFVPYTDLEKRFVAVGNEYLKHYPKAKETADIFYEQSYLFYSHFDLEKALKHFDQFIKEYPQHSMAVPSAYLVLDIHNRTKDYDKIILHAQRYLENKNLNKDNFRTVVSDILRHAELKKVEILEKEEKYVPAAMAYLDYIRNYGAQDPSLHEKALYNASINFSKANRTLDAVETQEKFLRNFPNSNLKQNMLLQVAKTYESIANFEKAAQYFKQFSELYPNHAQAKVASRLAGFYFYGAGNFEKAEKMMLYTIKMHPSENNTVLKDLLEMYESQNNTEKQIQVLSSLRAQKGVTYSEVADLSTRIIELETLRTKRLPTRFFNESWKFARAHEKEILSSPKGVEALSKMMFLLARQKETNFNAIRLNVSAEKMAAQLKRKLALLKELEKDYAKIASLGSPNWGLGAIFKTAYLYRVLANDVLNAPIPKDLSPEQVDIYRGELQKTFIKPFSEKSKNYVMQCLDKVQDLSLLSHWSSYCYQLASELDANRFPLTRTYYLPPLQTATLKTEDTKYLTKGHLKQFAYPYYSPLVFTSNYFEKRVINLWAIEPRDIASIPQWSNYRSLNEDRLASLTNALQSEKPRNLQKEMTFAYLNLSRMVNPALSINLIQDQIQKDSKNESLHNLLALAYLDQENLPAAKVIWLSQLARNVKSPEILNNLGVLYFLQGNESLANSYFLQAATSDDGIKEAHNNLGFIALKYRNGFEARKHFEKSLKMNDDDNSAKVGLSVAQVQTRDLDYAKESLDKQLNSYSNDPYAKLASNFTNNAINKEVPELKEGGEIENSRAIANDGEALPSLE